MQPATKTHSTALRSLPTIAFCLPFLLQAALHGQDVQTILTATSVSAGLAVVVGSTDGALESGLASGSLMVQGITTDPKAVSAGRAKIAAAGKFPVANVTSVAEYKKLPYATNLVNLLVADLDRLGSGAPSVEEIRRVLGFNGKAYVKRGGVWSVLDNPKPANLDEWPYQFYNEKRRFISNDMKAGPWSGLRWVAGPVKYWGNDQGLRIQNGVVFMVRRFYASDKRKNVNLPLNGHYLMARDAFSGLLLWYTPVPQFQPGRATARTGGSNFVAHNGKIFTYPLNGYLTAWDGRTGKVVKVYDQTVKPDPVTSTQEDNVPSHALTYATVFFHNGNMYQCYKNHLWMLDETTGAVKWHHQEPTDTNWIWQPVPGDDGDLYMAVTARGQEGGYKDNVDGHMPWIKALVRMDASTGKVIWRNEEEVKTYMGGFITSPLNGKWLVLLVYQTGGCPEPACFSTDNGKMLWFKPLAYQGANWTSAAGIILDGRARVIDAYYDQVIDLESGAPIIRMRLSNADVDNPGCMGTTMTPRFYIRGPRINARPATLPGASTKSTYFKAMMPMMFRPNCGELGHPAYGSIYCPGTKCGCTWYLPGDVSVYLADTVVPLDITKRLVSGSDGGCVVAGKVDSLQSKGRIFEDWMMAVDIQDGVKPSRWGQASLPSTSALKWYTTLTTTPVTSGDLSIRSIVHENRIEAIRGTTVAWSFLTGGRVSVPPVVANGLVIFGCHDGWVYALRSQDGSLVWRFFAAPIERRMVAYGQVESAWPLYGVLLGSGNVYYIAGRSTGADDGMTAGALEAATGKPKWRIRLAQYEGAKYGFAINSPLSSIDGKISYLGPAISPSSPADMINGSRDVVSARRRWAMPGSRWEQAGKLRVRYVDARGRALEGYLRDPGVGSDLRRLLAPGYYVAIPEDAAGVSKEKPALIIKR